MEIFTALIVGVAIGIWLVGIFAPWLVADTHDKLEEELYNLENPKTK